MILKSKLYTFNYSLLNFLPQVYLFKGIPCEVMQKVNKSSFIVSLSSAGKALHTSTLDELALSWDFSKDTHSAE